MDALELTTLLTAFIVPTSLMTFLSFKAYVKPALKSVRNFSTAAYASASLLSIAAWFVGQSGQNYLQTTSGCPSNPYPTWIFILGGVSTLFTVAGACVAGRHRKWLLLVTSIVLVVLLAGFTYVTAFYSSFCLTDAAP